MAISIASRDYPATTSTEDRQRLLRYGLVLLVSAVLHLALWQFRGILEWRPEPHPKPVRIIEVSLAAAPVAKGPEPPIQKQEPKKADQKPMVAPKPVAPLRPKPLLKPKPIPKPMAEPKPAPKPPVAEEASPRPREEAPPEPAAPKSTAEGSPAVPRNRSSGNVGEGKAEETARADYLKNPKPAYPAVARHRHWEGRVVLKVKVLADGTCGHVEIHQSSGHEVLDEAALEAVSNWRFSPAKRGGQPVESWVSVPINFNLEG